MKTIFLVDDDPTNLSVGKDALDGYYDVLTISSCRILFKILEKTVPDLILLDVEMPDINGYEAIKILKDDEKTRDIPVIFLTAKSNNENELMGLYLGAIDYVIKPFTPVLLRKRIEVHLQVEEQKKNLRAQKQELAMFNGKLLEMVENKSKTIFDLQSSILTTMAELVEFRDSVTGSHIERTTLYLGRHIRVLIETEQYADEISSWNLRQVLQSAQLHDIGKISVCDDILKKPGKLTDKEFEEIKKHTTSGEEIINKIMTNGTERDFLEHAKIFAVTHHEKWDGSGYPHGLKGEEIPLQGRLMAIADVYDALVSERPYKKAFSHEKAVKIILESKGTHFDPKLVDAFLLIEKEYNEIRSRLGGK